MLRGPRWAPLLLIAPLTPHSTVSSLGHTLVESALTRPSLPSPCGTAPRYEPRGSARVPIPRAGEEGGQEGPGYQDGAGSRCCIRGHSQGFRAGTGPCLWLPPAARGLHKKWAGLAPSFFPMPARDAGTRSLGGVPSDGSHSKSAIPSVSSVPLLVELAWGLNGPFVLTASSQTRKALSCLSPLDPCSCISRLHRVPWAGHLGPVRPHVGPVRLLTPRVALGKPVPPLGCCLLRA